MTKELEIRANIDTESVKALLIINGGGAVALLAFLPTVIGKPEYTPLARAALWGLFVFQFGLVSAVVHNRCRRLCSVVWQSYDYNPPRCKWFGHTFKEPCICMLSMDFHWLSLGAFLTAGAIVLYGGFEVLGVVK